MKLTLGQGKHTQLVCVDADAADQRIRESRLKKKQPRREKEKKTKTDGLFQLP